MKVHKRGNAGCQCTDYFQTVADCLSPQIPLQTILGELSERNAILPEDGDEIELENPLLYFSGFHPVAMQEAIKHVKSFQAITVLFFPFGFNLLFPVS